MSSGFFWLAVGAGLLAVITPCVFPLIPVTAAYFSDRGTSRAQAVRSGAFFALGIVFTFCIIGLGVAATVGAAGLARFASSASVNIGLAILFLMFGLALHGAHSFSLPSRFITAFTGFANRYDKRSIIGPMLLGVLFSLTSFTCTTPFVGTLLVLAARDQWVTPLAGMFVFSVVFALPFFILAVAPGFTQRLPRSGPWLDNAKRIVGILEVAAAVKFASNADMVLGWNVFTRDTVLFLWTMFAFAALFLLLSSVIRNTPALRATQIVSLVAAFFVAKSVPKHNLGSLEAFLPTPVIATRSSADPTVIIGSGVDAGWIMNDYNAALAQSRATGKPVFVDFTGYTCTNCRWMETNVFARPEVRKALDGFVLARLYTDGEGEMYERQQAFQEQKFSTVALPLYAIVDANGKTIATLAGLTRNPAEFLAFLQKAERPQL